MQVDGKIQQVAFQLGKNNTPQLVLYHEKGISILDVYMNGREPDHPVLLATHDAASSGSFKDVLRDMEWQCTHQ